MPFANFVENAPFLARNAANNFIYMREYARFDAKIRAKCNFAKIFLRNLQKLLQFMIIYVIMVEI